MESINSRIAQVKDYYCNTNVGFAEKIGVTPQRVGRSSIRTEWTQGGRQFIDSLLRH